MKKLLLTLSAAFAFTLIVNHASAQVNPSQPDTSKKDTLQPPSVPMEPDTTTRDDKRKDPMPGTPIPPELPPAPVDPPTAPIPLEPAPAPSAPDIIAPTLPEPPSTPVNPGENP